MTDGATVRLVRDDGSRPYKDEDESAEALGETAAAEWEHAGILRKQSIDGDGLRSQSRNGERDALAPAKYDLGIVAQFGGDGLCANFDAIVRQVDDPIFDDAILGVQLELDRKSVV